MNFFPGVRETFELDIEAILDFSVRVKVRDKVRIQG